MKIYYKNIKIENLFDCILIPFYNFLKCYIIFVKIVEIRLKSFIFTRFTTNLYFNNPFFISVKKKCTSFRIEEPHYSFASHFRIKLQRIYVHKLTVPIASVVSSRGYYYLILESSVTNNFYSSNKHWALKGSRYALGVRKKASNPLGQD